MLKKQFLAALLLLLSTMGFAQCISSPTLIKSYTVSAKGAGEVGLPSVSFDVPQTGTGKRFLMLFMTFERDHTPSPYGDNKESTLTGTIGDNINQMPNVKYGGVNMTKGTFLSSADQKSGHRYEDAYTYLSICNYMYFLPESSLPSGNNSFDLSAFSLPKNAGDEVKITVALFDYVKGIDKTKYGKYDFYDVGYVNSWSYENPDNLTTYSLTANMLSPNQPSGVTADKNILLTYGVNSSETGFSTSSTGWTMLESSSVNNTNGTYATDSNRTSGTSENDGISTALYSLTGVTGNRTINFNTNSSKKTLGGLLMMRLYGDAFTAPSVQNLTNTCPLTTVNLNDAHTGTIPTGAELRWYTNNSHTGTALTTAQIATAGVGTYYAFYYSNSCWSPASAAVTVTIDSCSTPIGCDNTIFMSSGDPTQLYAFDASVNPMTHGPVGSNSGIAYNAIAVNPIDGHLYGIVYNNSGGAKVNELIRITADGTVQQLGPIYQKANPTQKMPTATYTAGEIDEYGNFYIKGYYNNVLQKINLNSLPYQSEPISLTLNGYNATINDLAYNPVKGLLYALNENGVLITIDPSTGDVQRISTIGGGQPWGAMFGAADGSIYAARNAGGFYKINTETGERVLVADSPSSNTNDGAHCVTSYITFEADLSVTKTDGIDEYVPGTSTTYTIVVKNNGPFGVMNAKVEDLVPAGIPAANMTYTVVKSTDSYSQVTGTQTGAINDLVTLPVDGTVTYTVTIAIPADFTGDLVNTVTVTPPLDIYDPNMTNNTATDNNSNSNGNPCNAGTAQVPLTGNTLSN